jgi:hypothetical protein
MARKQWQARTRVNPCIVELIASLERLVAYAHTGHGKFTDTGLSAWLGFTCGLFDKGYPWINKLLLPMHSNRYFEASEWPFDDVGPLVSAAAAIQFWYNSQAASVSSFPFSLSFLPSSPRGVALPITRDEIRRLLLRRFTCGVGQAVS